MKLNSYSIRTSFVLIHKVSLYWPLEFKSRDFPEVNISRYKAINTDGCFMRIINCLPFASTWVRARYFSCVFFVFVVFVCLFALVSFLVCSLDCPFMTALSVFFKRLCIAHTRTINSECSI
jgi:hypothetical protein